MGWRKNVTRRKQGRGAGPAEVKTWMSHTPSLYSWPQAPPHPTTTPWQHTLSLLSLQCHAGCCCHLFVCLFVSSSQSGPAHSGRHTCILAFSKGSQTHSDALILFPLPPKRWDYRLPSPWFLWCWDQNPDPSVSGQRSNTWVHLQPLLYFTIIIIIIF